MPKPVRSVSLGLGLLIACLSVAAIPAAPAGASPVTTARMTLSGPSFWVEFVNRYSNRCLDDPSQSTTPGQTLQQWECNLTPAQQWEWSFDSNGYATIWNAQNGLCVADEGGWIGEGVPVVQAVCDGTPAQKWALATVGSLTGTYYLLNLANDNRTVGVPGWGVANGDQLAALTCTCGAYQQWIVNYVYNLTSHARITKAVGAATRRGLAGAAPAPRPALPDSR